MWFTYLLIVLEKVVSLHSWQSGMLMFIGQVTDALCTPLVGMLSDHSLLPGFLARFGRRKSWHIIGTACVSFSFPLIFSGCLLCQELHWLRMIWFIPPIAVFQFGWAAVQISHLAMIPELTNSEHTRMSMTSFRYGFTVIANLIVFGMLTMFLTIDGQGHQIGPKNLSSFRNLGFICVGLGLAVTAIFYAGISEPSAGQRRMSQLDLVENGSERQIQRMSWKNWFSHLNFYQTAGLYMFARVYINISQVYFSFYITQTLMLAKQFIALLPLTAFLSSFMISFFLGLSPVNRRVKGKPLFLSGAFVGVANCVLLFYTQIDWPSSSLVFYMIAVVLGLTQAVLLICSLNTTASLINMNTESGAFVYGAMSFLDKLSNGLIVQLVELFNPACREPTPGQKFACSQFYRDLMSMIPGACCLLILFVLLSMNLRTVGIRGASTLSAEETAQNSVEQNFEDPPAVAIISGIPPPLNSQLQ